MVDNLDLIQAMTVLEVKPGDVVVLKTAVRLSVEQSECIRQLVKGIVQAEVLVLSDGLDIGVLRQAA